MAGKRTCLRLHDGTMARVIAIKDAYSRASNVVRVGELAELVAFPMSYIF